MCSSRDIWAVGVCTFVTESGLEACRNDVISLTLIKHLMVSFKFYAKFNTLVYSATIMWMYQGYVRAFCDLQITKQCPHLVTKGVNLIDNILRTTHGHWMEVSPE